MTAGRRSIGSSSTPTTPSLVAKLNTYLEAEPGEFVFLHIALPDEIGHKDGFMSDRYLAGVRATDESRSARVLDTISARPALRRDTVVAADRRPRRRRRIPLRPEQDRELPDPVHRLGTWSARRTRPVQPTTTTAASPGTARTTYEGPQPIRNGEIANLATDVLGLPKVPGSEFDADQDLVIFAG